ncbi:hypothetical protein TRVA0_002S02850 [Trichomonascus vanleenenianus]|uniref:tetratricopeptide repeat protein n=1 Tax=Trichomonascus vanleenenianus TaxID=2268995 RepID=UPI003ECA893B
MELDHLVNPRAFQPLPEFIVPPPFKVDPEQIASYDLTTLVERRLYIPAAHRARSELIETDPKDYKEVLRLWGLRIRALMKARLGAIAREECRVFGDIGSDRYRLEDGTSVIPWDLRLVIVTIQASGDNQISLAKYYVMAREARAEAYKSSVRDPKETVEGLHYSTQVWQDRLRNLGVMFVPAALIAIGDIAAAVDHLENLHETAEAQGQNEFMPRVAFALAMAHLQIGDTIAAREWFEKTESGKDSHFLSAVCANADADWAEAGSLLEKVEDKDRLEVQNNYAVTRVHEGKLVEAVEVLEKVLRNGGLYATVVYNLFSLYDLLQDMSKDRRRKLMEELKESGIEVLGA